LHADPSYSAPLVARTPGAPHVRWARGAGGLMAIVLVLFGLTETVTIGRRGRQQIVLVGAFVAAPAVMLALCASRGRAVSRAER
jgi:hypothetical protein